MHGLHESAAFLKGFSWMPLTALLLSVVWLHVFGQEKRECENELSIWFPIFVACCGTRRTSQPSAFGSVYLWYTRGAGFIKLLHKCEISTCFSTK